MGTWLGFFEASTDAIPLCFSGIIVENLEHAECDTLHKRVLCLAPGGIVNYAPQILPWTEVDLLGQNLDPGLPCFFQMEVGVELEDLAGNVLYRTFCFCLSLSCYPYSLG